MPARSGKAGRVRILPAARSRWHFLSVSVAKAVHPHGSSGHAKWRVCPESCEYLQTLLAGEADHFIAVLQAKRFVISAKRNLVVSLKVALKPGKVFPKFRSNQLSTILLMFSILDH